MFLKAIRENKFLAKISEFTVTCLVITQIGYNPMMLWLPIFLYPGIFQKNYRKMTIKWSFSENSFVKLSLYNMIYL